MTSYVALGESWRVQTCVSVRLTCFICRGMCRHTPRARLAAFGYHDSKLIHGIWFEASDGVAECRGVCRLNTQNINTIKNKRRRMMNPAFRASTFKKWPPYSLSIVKRVSPSLSLYFKDYFYLRGWHQWILTNPSGCINSVVFSL